MIEQMRKRTTADTFKLFPLLINFIKILTCLSVIIQILQVIVDLNSIPFLIVFFRNSNRRQEGILIVVHHTVQKISPPTFPVKGLFYIQNTKLQ